MNIEVKIPNSFEQKEKLNNFIYHQIDEKLLKRTLDKNKVVKIHVSLKKSGPNTKTQIHLKYAHSDLKVMKTNHCPEASIIDGFKSLKRICLENRNFLPRYNAKQASILSNDYPSPENPLRSA